MNDLYKKRHKPQKYGKTKQGYYTPLRNPGKCLTNVNTYRSGWEFNFFDWCDRNPRVLRWASEPIAIEYLNPIENMKYCMEHNLDPNNPRNQKVCKYYPDVWIEYMDSDQKMHHLFIEIKPAAQAQPPTPLPPNPKRKDIKKFNDESAVFLVNQAKWVAAKAYCEARGAEFMVFTENEFRQYNIPTYTK